ncbi:MAG: hypothetical protein K2J89_02015, partial [Clostridia bacterium]|nr:hypothetical protein [Clostridia bacterium]
GKEYELTLDCADEDIGKLRFEGYYTGGGITEETRVAVQPVMSATEKKVTIRLPRLSDKGTYSYILKLAEGIAANGNYTLSFNYSFEVGNKKIDLSSSDIVWRYANSNIEGGTFKSVDVSDLDIDGVFNVDYNGYGYSFEVNILELSEDIRDSIDYEYAGIQSATDVKIGSGNVVEYYTVTFKISPKNGNTSIDIVTEEFSLKWRVNKALFDLTNVRWDYTTEFQYNELRRTVTLSGLPRGLTADLDGNSGVNVNNYTAEITALNVDGAMSNNYVRPIIGDKSTYIYEGIGEDVPWTLEWKIVVGVLNLEWERIYTYTEVNGRKFVYPQVKSEYADKVEYKYYTASGYANGDDPIELRDIEVVPEQQDRYVAVAILKDEWVGRYEISELTKTSNFTVGSTKTEILIEMEQREYVYDGEKHGDGWKIVSGTISLNRIIAKYYVVAESGEETPLEEAPRDAGKYVVRFEIEEAYQDTFELGIDEIGYEIKKAQILAVWNTEGEIPVIENATQVIEYEYSDEEGNIIVDVAQLEKGKKYTAVAKIKSEYVGNYEFVDADGIVLAEPTVTEGQEFEIKAEEPTDPENPNDPNNPNNPNEPADPGNNGDDNKDPGDGSNPIDSEKVKEFLQKYWQPIVTLISILLILIFTGKGLGYASKRKENKRTIESKYSTYYVVSGTGLFGLTYTNWTIVACIMMGVAVLAVVFMLLEKRGYKKSQRELEDAKEEFIRNQEEAKERRRDEEMKMMLMHLMGGNANGGMNGNVQQGGYVYAGQGLGAEEMKGMITEVVTALLPGVQQMLPQQASANDETVQKLIDQNEKLMKKLEKQQPVERIIEKEVVATSVSEEVLDRLAGKLQPATTDDTIKRILDNQETLMEKILQLSANQQPNEPQVVEKIVEVPVEKIVEKEVVKEVPIEVEKVIEKIVEIPAQKPATKSKTATPRLTLDEAYEKLSAKQKKFFDTLKAYALSKDKCKEKKSTYYILLGQSSVNPLVKLTIKKDTTVALFKMEDEFMKDIRRNATNDGAKIKVKETEVVIADVQAMKAAKDMIDLREDQIERYNEYLKEQRAMKK